MSLMPAIEWQHRQVLSSGVMRGGDLEWKQPWPGVDVISYNAYHQPKAEKSYVTLNKTIVLTRSIWPERFLMHIPHILVHMEPKDKADITGLP